MGFEIVTLMENGALSDCLAAEHGLSLLIRGEGRRILYDTGASPRFLKNAEDLGEDLAPLDALVFSHGHYDHTGGAAALLTAPVRPGAVYWGRDFFAPRRSRKRDGLMDIGAAVSPAAFAEIPCRQVGQEPVAAGPGIWLLSGFVSQQPMEGPVPGLLRQTDRGLEPDEFGDEVAVVLETDRELALISGCSHVGILSMCSQVSRRFGRPVTVFVGGTHLMDAEEERIRFTCERLRQWGVRRLGACHCSGERAAAYFTAHFPGFFANHTGSRVTIEGRPVERTLE